MRLARGKVLPRETFGLTVETEVTRRKGSMAEVETKPGLSINPECNLVKVTELGYTCKKFVETGVAPHRSLRDRTSFGD